MTSPVCNASGYVRISSSRFFTRLYRVALQRQGLSSSFRGKCCGFYGWCSAALLCLAFLLRFIAIDCTAAEDARPAVSYYRDVRPIFQANCQGCHQPAKSKGGYSMTEFKRLLVGGDSEGTAVVPSHP